MTITNFISSLLVARQVSPAPPGFFATSTTPLLIGGGSKTFVTQAGTAFRAGQYIRLISDAFATNYMEGNITSYSGTSMVVNVTRVGVTSSGTHSDWTIAIAGSPGSGDLLSSLNLSDLANIKTARVNLGIPFYSLEVNYGADGTAANDTAALRAAVLVGGTILFQPRVYLLNNLGDADGVIKANAVPGQNWIGVPGQTILRQNNATALDPIFFQSMSGLVISGITFDSNNLQTDGRIAGFGAVVFLNHVTGCVVENCTFIGWTKIGLFGNDVKDTAFVNNKFERFGGVATTYNQALKLFTLAGDQFPNCSAIGNRSLYSGFGFAGNHITVTHNYIKTWNFSAALNFQFDDHHNIVEFNHLDGSDAFGSGNLPPDVDGTICGGIEAWANYSSYSNNIIENCPGNGIGAGPIRSLISNNIIMNCGQYTTSVDEDNRCGIAFAYADASHNANHTLITGNNCFDTRGVSATQLWGIREAGANSTGVVISGNNKVSGNKNGGVFLRTASTVNSAFGSWPSIAGAITSGTGGLTTATATYKKRHIGGSLFFLEVTATVTSAGTGATSLKVALTGLSPLIVGTRVFCGYNITTKKDVTGTNIDGATIEMTYYDGTFPGASGASIVISGYVECDTN